MFFSQYIAHYGSGHPLGLISRESLIRIQDALQGFANRKLQYIMGFIVVPFDFVSSDNADKDSMGIPVPKIRGDMAINANQINVYYGDNTSVTIRMSDGEDYSIPMGIDEFESVLSEIEMICDLSKLIKEN